MSDDTKTRYHAGHGAEVAIVLSGAASDHMNDRAVAHEVGLPSPEQPCPPATAGANAERERTCGSEP